MARYVCKVKVWPDRYEWHCVDLERKVEAKGAAFKPAWLTQLEMEGLRRIGFEVTVELGE